MFGKSQQHPKRLTFVMDISGSMCLGLSHSEPASLFESSRPPSTAQAGIHSIGLTDGCSDCKKLRPLSSRASQALRTGR